MEIKNENKNFDVDNYIKEVEQKLYECSTPEEIGKLKNEVTAVYIAEYNQQILKSSLVKISGLMTKIETKEKSISKDNEIIEIGRQELELMKKYTELLENINKINKLLDS